MTYVYTSHLSSHSMLIITVMHLCLLPLSFLHLLLSCSSYLLTSLSPHPCPSFSISPICPPYLSFPPPSSLPSLLPYVLQSGDSITIIAQCWRDIVRTRVTSVVHQFDQYDSPQALAADLVSVYDQLKQAMLELFGGHSTFALSLKEGFSKAFRSLNEMQGLRVRFTQHTHTPSPSP